MQNREEKNKNHANQRKKLQKCEKNGENGQKWANNEEIEISGTTRQKRQSGRKLAEKQIKM